MEFSGGRGGADICPQNVAFALNSNFPCKGLFLMISVVMAAYNGEQYIYERLALYGIRRNGRMKLSYPMTILRIGRLRL